MRRHTGFQLAFAAVGLLVVIYLGYKETFEKINELQPTWSSIPAVYSIKDAVRPFGNIQSNRVALVKEYCKQNADKTRVFPPLSRFVVSEKYKLLYCQVFKTGSTTTLTILHNLEHGVERSTREMRQQLDKLPFRRLEDYSNDEVLVRLETYTKLLIAREPLERLASAWRNKFVDVPLRFWFRKEYHSMLETLSRDKSNEQYDFSEMEKEDVREKPVFQMTSNKDVGNETYPIVPFVAFIKAVATNRTEWQNPHWELISDLCAPCQIDYDFVANTETLAEDFPEFFRKAGINGEDNLLPDVRARKSERLFWYFYRQVSMQDLWRIKVKFAADYEMFGYSFDETINSMLNKTK